LKAAAVIDTNVLLVANGSHAGVSVECRAACVDRLLAQHKSGVTVIDDGYRILSEYQNKTRPNQPKGVGDVFLKWLLQNQANSARVHQVAITESSKDEFAEFADVDLQAKFDAPDRKFVAVASAHSDKPPIWQASDSKWLDWWPALLAKGVRVEFLCPSDIQAPYQRKFPRRPTPTLPRI
jgi:hypothetical protein